MNTNKTVNTGDFIEAQSFKSARVFVVRKYRNCAMLEIVGDRTQTNFLISFDDLAGLAARLAADAKLLSLNNGAENSAS